MTELTNLDFDKLGLEGRTQEAEALETAYQAAFAGHSSGTAHVCLVQGYSGVGKSTLISSALTKGEASGV